MRIPKPSKFLLEIAIIVIAAAIYLPGLISPPHLMDDVDAAEALQAKNMMLSGDWTTQRLNGTPYLDKAPLKYWITAALYQVFGVHDWVARIPTVIAVILLCWLVVRMGQWAESAQMGFYAGLTLATSLGLYLFTRTVMPDVILTLFIALSLWCFIRLVEGGSASFAWAIGMYWSMALAVLTKGFIGVLFPVTIAAVYLAITHKRPRLYVIPGILLFLAIAAPWHILAILHNPPIFDLTLHPGDHFGGKFRGFFWFYFVNEQLLRFLNERWPRDYNTVPRLWFWFYHLLWFFPWSLALPSVLRLSFKPIDRAGRMRLLALCWILVVMLFFSLSTTQEYYSMPIYPAVALLLGSAMGLPSKWLRVSGAIFLGAAFTIAIILVKVWTLPAPGDIYTALSQHPDLYTLSLGHMADLTLPAFAYLRTPLLLACTTLLLGGLAAWSLPQQRAYVAIAISLVVFFQAARLALIVFDPYLSSFAIAEKLNRLPPGNVIICGKYNPLSSVFFYSNDKAMQNDGDLDILEYGSLAPGARRIAVSNDEMKKLWNGSAVVYVIAKAPRLGHIKDVLGSLPVNLLCQSGDKYLFANQAGN